MNERTDIRICVRTHIRKTKNDCAKIEFKMNSTRREVGTLKEIKWTNKQHSVTHSGPVSTKTKTEREEWHWYKSTKRLERKNKKLRSQIQLTCNMPGRVALRSFSASKNRNTGPFYNGTIVH